MWIVSVHVDLDIPRWDFPSLAVGDVEGDVGSSSVMFKARGCRRQRAPLVVRCGSTCVRGEVVVSDDGGDRVDGPALSSAKPSLGSSSYTHPLGNVGRRKCSGIFIIFLDETGQSIDQCCSFCTVEVNVDHVPGWCGSRSDR